MAKPMKYKFRCAKCGKEYPANSEGWISPKSKKIYCKDCLEKSDNPNANSVRESSKPKVAASGAGAPTITNSTTPNAPAPMPLTSRQIEDITAEAVQSIRKREELESLDISELIPLIAEQMAIRRVQKEQEFSLAMSKHIQQIKLDNIRKVKGE